MTRIDRDELYMEIARLFARRSTCKRGQVGCVAVRDNHIICAGYNGAPKYMDHCLDVGCGGGERKPNPEWVPLTEQEMVVLDYSDIARRHADQYIEEFPNGCTRSIHAELNMVTYASKIGVSLDGCTVYATHGPCLPCAQALIGSGTAKLVYETPYRLPEGLELIHKAHIKVMKYDA